MENQDFSTKSRKIRGGKLEAETAKWHADNLALTSGAMRTGLNCRTVVRIIVCAKKHHLSAWENQA